MPPPISLAVVCAVGHRLKTCAPAELTPQDLDVASRCLGAMAAWCTYQDAPGADVLIDMLDLHQTISRLCDINQALHETVHTLIMQRDALMQYRVPTPLLDDDDETRSPPAL